MPVSVETALLFAIVAGAAATAVVAVRIAARRRARDRVLRNPVETAADALPGRDSALSRWLALAGFRGRQAARSFLLATVAAVVLGGVAAFALAATGVLETSMKWVEEVPGSLGDLFVPALYLGPWILGLLIACIPMLRVRAARRNRVERIERELPAHLELLATLGEAGLGFDASIDRLLVAAPAGSVLADELRTFQRESLAGVSRVQCFRRLSRRIDVGSVSSFVSALVHSEQVGSGFAEVLRRQADDLRGRRRERATALSQSLPVKLVFPLVICFLPGVFVTTLGPAFHSFFKLADQFAVRRP